MTACRVTVSTVQCSSPRLQSGKSATVHRSTMGSQCHSRQRSAPRCAVLIRAPLQHKQPEAATLAIRAYTARLEMHMLGLVAGRLAKCNCPAALTPLPCLGRVVQLDASNGCNRSPGLLHTWSSNRSLPTHFTTDCGSARKRGRRCRKKAVLVGAGGRSHRPNRTHS